MSVKVLADARRRPPIQWSVETSTPSIVVVPPVAALPLGTDAG